MYMYMYMYICICIYVYVYICICIYVSVYVSTNGSNICITKLIVFLLEYLTRTTILTGDFNFHVD